MPWGSLHDTVLAYSLPKLTFFHFLLIILLVVTLGMPGKAPEGFGESLCLGPASSSCFQAVPVGRGCLVMEMMWVLESGLGSGPSWLREAGHTH